MKQRHSSWLRLTNQNTSIAKQSHGLSIRNLSKTLDGVKHSKIKCLAQTVTRVGDLPTKQYGNIPLGSRSSKCLRSRSHAYESRRFRGYSIQTDEYFTFRRFDTSACCVPGDSNKQSYQ